MGRAPCCDKANVKKGPWSPEEDAKLKEYIGKNGTGGNWISLPQKAGLKRCGKSCRLRWLNYLRPNIKHGEFSDDEDKIICSLYANIGSRWSIIAAQLPGRTDNDIKNYWNTKLKKKLMGLLPNSSSHHHRKLPFHHQLTNYTSLLQSSPLSNSVHNNNNNYGLIRPLIGSDQMTMIPSSSPSLSTSNNSFNSFNSSAMQQQQQHYQQVKDGVLVFGPAGTEPSCSSSDGSSNNVAVRHHGNHHVKEFDCDAEQQQQLQMGGSIHHDHQQQGTASNNGGYGTTNFCNPNGTWSDQIMNNSPLEDYGLEEIKQLVSTGSCNNNDSNSLLLFGDNRTEERIMFY